jgi:hypothetical protein
MATPTSVIIKEFTVAFGATENLDIALESFNLDGFLSMQLALVGDGNIDLSWKVSNDGETFLKPSSQDNVLLTGFDDTSGEDSNGTEFIHTDEIQAPLSTHIRFIFEEASSSDPVTLTVRIAIA